MANPSVPVLRNSDNDSHIITTQSSTDTTLDANRTLQASLQYEFRSITKAIHHNRFKADQLVRQLLLLERTANVSCDKRQQRKPTNGLQKTYKRRWTRRFFADHKGTEPRPNVDTLRRRAIEQQSIFYHTQPPWAKETIELLSTVQDVRDEARVKHDDTDEHYENEDEGKVDDASSGTIDFKVVADVFNWNRGIRRANGSRNISYHRRSAKECEIQYCYESTKNSTKQLFNDAQQRAALSQIVATMASEVGAMNMNWDKVAEEVSSAMQQYQPQNTTFHYTAWDCLVAYHTKLKTPLAQLQTTTSVWTREEDELLFKFIAAAGPQMVMDSKNVLVQSTLCTQLLPHKSKKQIFTRANHSLLNPNMQRNDWSDYEERRLPICMKIYYTPSPQDGYQMYCTSTHCYGRSMKSVVDKWNRSINPAYSTKPFTVEEDEALLQIMRSVLEKDNNSTRDNLQHFQKQSQHIGWVELSQNYFPQRHPQRLQSRWSELATDQDIINRENAKLSVENNITNNDTNERRQRKGRAT